MVTGKDNLKLVQPQRRKAPEKGVSVFSPTPLYKFTNKSTGESWYETVWAYEEENRLALIGGDSGIVREEVGEVTVIIHYSFTDFLKMRWYTFREKYFCRIYGKLRWIYPSYHKWQRTRRKLKELGYQIDGL